MTDRAPSKDQDAIQKLNQELDGVSQLKNISHELRAVGDLSYMDGFSGMIEDEPVALVDRADMANGIASSITSTANVTPSTDTCDDETDVAEATPMPLSNVTSTSTEITTTR